MNTGNRKKDIAVIGMAGVFPKANDLTVFWEKLINGEELTHHFSEEEIGAELMKTPNFLPVESVIDNSDSFDYKFFGYTHEEASLMDPQIRVMHEQVYKALDNAGYAHQVNKNIIGLYLSASDNINWRLLEMFYTNGKVSKFLAQRLSNKDFISTLISYKLGLKGPGFFVDTACSGSLTNLHLACRSLLLKECNIAISGGVSIGSTEHKGYFYEEGLIASADGHCRAFDENASGTIWGEGAGAVVLKRYEDAVRDNDYIYAVIKATAVNNDGKRKVGYTAPSIEGQSECIKMAHRIAGVQPESIGYIEAHGTGTRLGDPIEIESLNIAFNHNKEHKCAIGSVKTNMGHLDAAAGIAGFIKACLSLNYKMIPPSLNFSNPNPQINFDDGPFYVNASLKKWESENIRRAGVSSFGIGGTNCHVVLEEFIHANLPNKQNAHNLLTFSAKTPQALQNYKASISSFLKKNQNCNYEDFSFSVNNKVRSFPYKDHLVFENTEDACLQLDSSTPVGPSKNYENIIFMFPGQGTQYFQMGKELYANQPFFRRVMDEGFEILKKESDVDYKKIIGYEEDENQDLSLINKTKYTQPLLFLIEFALAQTLISFGVKPTCMIGHSLGEYVAACVSNVFSLEDGLKIILKRASLMDEMKHGSMIAIKANVEEVLNLVEGKLSIAAVNVPNTCVLSGETEQIEALASILKEKDISCSILKTSHAFHSHMMDEMLEPFKEALKDITFSKPEVPFISNVTGGLVTDMDLSGTYWTKHIRSAVLFQKGLNQLIQKWPAGKNIFIEVGPGRVLLNLLKSQSDEAYLGIPMLKSVKEKKNDFKQFLNNLGLLWKAEVQINTSFLYHQSVRKIPVPSYVFDKTSLPSRVDPLKFIQGELNANADTKSIISNLSTDSLFNKKRNKSSDEEQFSDNLRMNLTQAFKPPQNETQKKLCAIWTSFLGETQIGIEDDFFELGGDSLKALSILTAIKKEFNCAIEIQELYDDPNIKNISSKIEILNKLKNRSKKVSQKNTIKI